jgi:hypothetical protein
MIDLVDPKQDCAANDQRKADHPGIEKMCLDELSGEQADDDRWQKRDQEADDEAPIIRIGEHAKRDPPQFWKIKGNDGEDRAELNQDRKTLPEIGLTEIKKTFYKQQMAGRGDRQELGYAFDNAEDHRSQRV